MVRVHMWRRPATPAPRQRPAPPPHTAPGPAGAAPAARDQGSARNVQEVLAELDALVGLREVKALVREMR
ncbi:MAG: hypothetical protein H5T97_09455, partial [Firmicutes bacterium]|nr:hypothetical protein [Bacillota bacterium]